jgi:Tol biopolymer transport system component
MIVFKRGTSEPVLTGSGIFVVDVASGRISRVISTPSEIWYPNFGADGRTVLFTMEHRHRLALWTVDVTGGPSTPLMRGAFGAYSPDGTAIAFRRTAFDGHSFTAMTSYRLWIARADGANPRAVTAGSEWMSQGDPNALWPVWSPDGTHVAFQRHVGDAIVIADVHARRIISMVEPGIPSWLDHDTLIVSWYS